MQIVFGLLEFTLLLIAFMAIWAYSLLMLVELQKVISKRIERERRGEETK